MFIVLVQFFAVFIVNVKFPRFCRENDIVAGFKLFDLANLPVEMAGSKSMQRDWVNELDLSLSDKQTN